MEEKELLEQTNETEKVETQTTEEMVEGIELTDTTDADEANVNEPEKEEVRKTLKELLKENPDYQEELENEILKPRISRMERNHQKELSKYKDTDNVLRTTLNLKDGDDTNAKLREYYEAEGIKLPEVIKPGLSDREIELLANADADEIIADGHEATFNEAERLAKIGYKNLNQRDRIIFNKLAETLNNEKDKTELLKLGAKEQLLSDKSFIDFRKKFNSNVPIKDIYELYVQRQPKQVVDNPGSMRNDKVKQPKTIFTDEDIAKMTDEELEANWDAIRKYQTSGNH